MQLPFGKYRGVRLGEVPAPYLRWLLEQPGLFNETRQRVQSELDRRQRERAPSGAPASVALHPDPQPVTKIRNLKPDERALERRLEAAGWLRSGAGFWSRWWPATHKRPGWACYQISRTLAAAIQDYLDAQRSRRVAA
jgi:hypothetical protein